MAERRIAGSREGKRFVRGVNPHPFSETVVGYIGAWADQRLDISHPAVSIHAPELIEVILARAFGDPQVIYRSWRKTQIALQLIAEEQVGAPRRADAQAARDREDAGFEALKAAIK